MKSIDFNGATASSLLLLSKEEIDIIMNATRRRIDSIQAEDMMNCLIYMRELLKNIKFSNNTIAKKFLTGVASLCDSKKTIPTTDVPDDGVDLFGELGETDLFSDLEGTDSSTEAISLFNLETIDEKSFEQIVELGSSYFDDDVNNIILDLIEIKTKLKALDARIKVKNRSILEMVNDGSLVINPDSVAWRDKECLLDAIASNRISMYDLSIDECKAIIDIIDNDESLQNFIYHQDDVKKSKEELLAEKLITVLKEESESQCGDDTKINYLIRQFLYKSNKVGNIEYKLLGISLNRLDLALSGKYFISKCESISNFLKKNGFRSNVIQNLLVQTEKIEELIKHSSHVECNEAELQALITLKDYLLINGVFTDVNYDENEVLLMKDFLRKLNSKNLLIQSHSSQENYEPSRDEKDEDDSRNYTLYNEYNLYKLKDLFTLDKLGEKIDSELNNFEVFMQVNKILLDKYKIIPLTLPGVYENGLLRSIDDGARISYAKYEKILPNLQLLKRDLQSIDFRQNHTCRIIID